MFVPTLNFDLLLPILSVLFAIDKYSIFLNKSIFSTKPAANIFHSNPHVVINTFQNRHRTFPNDVDVHSSITFFISTGIETYSPLTGNHQEQRDTFSPHHPSPGIQQSISRRPTSRKTPANKRWCYQFFEVSTLQWRSIGNFQHKFPVENREELSGYKFETQKQHPLTPWTTFPALYIWCNGITPLSPCFIFLRISRRPRHMFCFHYARGVLIFATVFVVTWKALDIKSGGCKLDFAFRKRDGKVKILFADGKWVQMR